MRLSTGATVVKRTTLLPWLVTMARPMVGPGTGIVVMAPGLPTVAGIGRMTTVDVSRSTATAKSPPGDTVRSVGALGSGTVVSVPSASESMVTFASPSRRTSAYVPSGVNETSGAPLAAGAAPSSPRPRRFPRRLARCRR